MLDPLTLRRQQLDEVRAAVGLGGSEDLRKVGAETGVIGQRALLSDSWRQSRDRRTPKAFRMVGGVCDPDHMVATRYRPQPASTNLPGRAAPLVPPV